MATKRVEATKGKVATASKRRKEQEPKGKRQKKSHNVQEKAASDKDAPKQKDKSMKYVLEEMEKEYKASGGLKYAVFQVLKQVKEEGIKVEDILPMARKMGHKKIQKNDGSKELGECLMEESRFVVTDNELYMLQVFEKQQNQKHNALVLQKKHLAKEMKKLQTKESKLEESKVAKEAQIMDAEKERQQLKQRAGGKKAFSEVAVLQSISPSELMRFEIDDKERVYRGDPEDRKCMLEHRQKVQARVRELEKAKAKYIKGKIESAEEMRKMEASEARDLETRIKKHKQELDGIDEKLKAVKKDVAALDKRLSKLPDRAKVSSTVQKQKGARVKKKEQAVPKPVIKYPIEDLDINDIKHPYMPAWMDEESSARMSKLLIVSDNLILIGSRSLGIKAPSLDELNRIIHETSDVESIGDYIRDPTADSIGQLYHSIIEFLLNESSYTGKASSAEKRWYRVLSEGTWPEILRRFVLSRDTDAWAAYERPDSHATLAVSMLNYDPIESLTFDQHISILYFLVNDVLINSNAVSDLLQRRENAAINAKKDARDEMAEERKRIKELRDAKKSINNKNASENSNMNEDFQASQHFDEKVFNLPEELQKYNGDPNDKEALSDFEKRQASAKRKLEKERTRWLADQLRAKRAEEARLRKIEEEKLALQKESKSAEEALMLAEQAYRERIEKLKLRQEPIGVDRFYRKYFWGLAGLRGALFIIDEDDNLSEVNTENELHTLFNALDPRGIREKALKESIEKNYESICNAMRRRIKEIGAAEVEPNSKDQAPPPRQSSRPFRQVEFFDPSKRELERSKNSRKAPKQYSIQYFQEHLSILSDLPVSVLVALADAMSSLMEICSESIRFGVNGPASDSHWTAWTEAVTCFGKQHGSDDFKKLTVVDILRILQSKTIEMESILNQKSNVLQGKVSALQNDESFPSSEDEEQEGDDNSNESGSSKQDSMGPSDIAAVQGLQLIETIDSSFSPRKNPKESKFLWQTLRERLSWLSDIKSSSASASRLAFCIKVFQAQSRPLLRFLKKSDAPA
eukprot:jgi/Picsp_1/1584/NSC_05062-R1_nucleosome positioning protein